MGVINLAELKPGMVLAEDLRDRNGRFLLAKGTRLTLKHLRILKIWGVIEVNIEGISQKNVESNTGAQIDPAIMETAEKEIRERFVHTDLDHPATRELFRLCTLRKAEELDITDSEAKLEHHDSYERNMDANEILEDTTTEMSPLEFIRDDISLSTLPDIFILIKETINDPKSSARDIAEAISKDTNISAKLLKLVNSAFYGFPSKIDTISRAVAIVGTKHLSILTFGIYIINAFKNISWDLIDMKSFWEHSIVCGTIARILASHKNIQNTERLFVAGLLHDIGRLVFYNSTSINARNIILKARNSHSLLYEIEHEIMNFDHTELGKLILKKWKLPMSLENIVKYHHYPMLSNDPLEPAIVHLSDIMTNALGMGSSGERFVPPLDQDAWTCIGLSPNILALTIKQMEHQVRELVKFLVLDER